MARPEVTGKKLAPLEPALGAYTVPGFCRAHGLSLSMYYKMKARGEAPDEMDVGRHKTVSVESAAKWRRKREAAARKSQENKETKEFA
jgi:hypothetical protein